MPGEEVQPETKGLHSLQPQVPCLACGVLGSVCFLTRGPTRQPSVSVALFVARIGILYLRDSQTPPEKVNWNALDWSLGLCCSPLSCPEQLVCREGKLELTWRSAEGSHCFEPRARETLYQWVPVCKFLQGLHLEFLLNQSWLCHRTKQS